MTQQRQGLCPATPCAQLGYNPAGFAWPSMPMLQHPGAPQPTLQPQGAAASSFSSLTPEAEHATACRIAKPGCTGYY
eukprot:596137-Pleurochrysis_carterae.AAC.3